jgi:hypothetical protein
VLWRKLGTAQSLVVIDTPRRGGPEYSKPTSNTLFFWRRFAIGYLREVIYALQRVV